jgi:hypothetical protein
MGKIYSIYMIIRREEEAANFGPISSIGVIIIITINNSITAINY